MHRLNDGRDYVSMPLGKIFLVQLLNIAGLGPIFGPLMGALYGPTALLWIVVGCIFAGAVHDYFTGMLSIRHDGLSVPNIVKHYLGNGISKVMTAFCIIVTILTGMVFVVGPAGLLAELTKPDFGQNFWVAIIFLYYFLATIFPIDTIIGKVYPFFGFFLILMAVSLLGAVCFNDTTAYIPASFWTSHHPSGLSAWPAVFITIACGAVSGFHSTQSPIMSRCIENEKHGRLVFYGR